MRQESGSGLKRKIGYATAYPISESKPPSVSRNLHDRTSEPHQQQTESETQSGVKPEVEPLFLLQEQIHVVGERREGRESSAETGDEEDIHLRRNHLRFLRHSEEDADYETAYHVHGESSPRECRHEQQMTEFSGQESQARADESAETGDNHCF